MNYFLNNKPFEDRLVMHRICSETLLTQNLKKESSDNFAAVFVEGRDRFVNSIEELAAIWSFKVFSKFNYPVYLLVNNDTNILGGDQEFLNCLRIKVIKIPELNSLDAYSDFCIKNLYTKYLPPEIDNLLHIQSDGFLMKDGWEEFVLDNGFDYIGAHFRHFPAIKTIDDLGKPLFTEFKGRQIGNGGFSFRKLSKMKLISEKYSNYKMIERGTENKLPPEDVFFSFFGFNDSTLKLPSLKDCDVFCQDPLTLSAFINKGSYGFHCAKLVSEWSVCNHD